MSTDTLSIFPHFHNYLYDFVHAVHKLFWATTVTVNFGIETTKKQNKKSLDIFWYFDVFFNVSLLFLDALFLHCQFQLSVTVLAWRGGV